MPWWVLIPVVSMITGPLTLYLMTRRKQREQRVDELEERYEELEDRYAALLEESAGGTFPTAGEPVATFADVTTISTGFGRREFPRRHGGIVPPRRRAVNRKVSCRAEFDDRCHSECGQSSPQAASRAAL